jgi:endonuclease III
MAKPPVTFQKVHDILEKKYQSPHHYIKHDPFSELIIIVCSIQTSEKQYLSAYSKIKSIYPNHNDLLSASRLKLASIIGKAGLGYQKADCLIQCVQKIKSRFGRVSLSPLKNSSDVDCESFLTSLPRVGLKSARCIMMYSLDRLVFPVVLVGSGIRLLMDNLGKKK